MWSTRGCESWVRVRATNPATPSLSGGEQEAALPPAALTPHRCVKRYLERCLPAAMSLVSRSLPCCFHIILHSCSVNSQPPVPAFIKHGWLISQPGRCALFLRAFLEMYSKKGLSNGFGHFSSSVWAQRDSGNCQVGSDLDFALLMTVWLKTSDLGFCTNTDGLDLLFFLKTAYITISLSLPWQLHDDKSWQPTINVFSGKTCLFHIVSRSLCIVLFFFYSCWHQNESERGGVNTMILSE